MELASFDSSVEPEHFTGVATADELGQAHPLHITLVIIHAGELHRFPSHKIPLIAFTAEKVVARHPARSNFGVGIFFDFRARNLPAMRTHGSRLIAEVPIQFTEQPVELKEHIPKIHNGAFGSLNRKLCVANL